MISAILAVLAAAPAAPSVSWTAPMYFVEGRPFNVHVEYKADKPGVVPTWLLGASAFTIDGKPLDDKKAKGEIELTEGSNLVLDLDLREAIESSKAFKKTSFKLGLEGSNSKAIDVRFLVPAPKGLNFMDEKKTPADTLGKYLVLLETNRGNMLAEMWPDVAPRHVRNYLDLAYTGFYDKVLFHRVGPGFMIQGGDPNTKDASKAGEWGTGNGPRMVNAEFNTKKHARGVLSMARGGDVNSASCQFFVMHAAYPSLDGKYSAFGMLLDGFDTLDKIVNSPGSPLDPQGTTLRPNEPQRIEHAFVLVAP